MKYMTRDIKSRNRKFKHSLKNNWQKHLMMLPMVIILFIFCYIPMTGLVMAFQNYLPAYGYFGSPWTGFYWFKYMFGMQNFLSVIWNTLFLSIMKIITCLLCSIVFALFLNEVRFLRFRTYIQSMVLFPFFISWVILAGILKDLAASDGILNTALASICGTTVPFLIDDRWFIILLVISNTWKDMGYNAIIILAALASIRPELYEAATIDGATRLQRLRYVSLPGIGQIVAMLLILALGNVLSGGFDQVYNMYNVTVMKSSDIIDTYVYRMGVNGGLYSLGTAVGFFKSVVGSILLIISYKAAEKYAGYQVF